MSTLRFVLRTDKLLKNSKAPVDLIYQISGQRKYFRTDLRLYEFNWNPVIQKAVYVNKKAARKIIIDISDDSLLTNTEVDEINNSLSAITLEIAEIEKRYVINKMPYSAEMVLDNLKHNKSKTTKKTEPKNEVFEFIEQYIKDHKTTREPGSLANYNAVKNHLQRYCKKENKKVTFSNIDYNFFQSFQNYLIDVEGLNNNTVAKQLSTVKTFLNYARRQGIEVSMKYKDFKIKRESLEVIALTESEFQTLYNLDLSTNKRLAQVRDIFCFACSTGLRYSDLYQLSWEHIKADEIKITVTKTKEPLSVPLTSYSRKILAKYESTHRPLPMISNQKLNDYIKELCKLAAINEPIEIVRFRGVKREAIIYPKYELIGVHTGRKTFATLSLEKGMSAEEVMAITGHKDYKSFKRYVKITEERKKLVMRNAWDLSVQATVLKVV